MGNVVCIKCGEQIYPVRECGCDEPAGVHNEANELWEYLERKKREKAMVECPHCGKLILL